MKIQRSYSLLALALVFAFAGFAQGPKVQAVLNAGSLLPQISPGGFTQVFGTGLGPSSVQQGAAQGQTVTVNNVSAYIYLSTATALIIQIPFETQPGNANLVVTYQGQSSAPFGLTILPFAPALFSANGSGKGAGVFTHANGTIVQPSAPAQAGETLITSATGLGQTNPPAQSGKVTPASPVALTIAQPQLTIGSKPAIIRFSGLAPLEVGSYQINFTVPGDLTPGIYAVTLTVNGVPSNSLSLPVGISGLVIDRTGFTIDAVQGAAPPPAVNIALFNLTGKSLANVTATASTTSGGNWLSVSPGSMQVGLVGSQFAVTVNQSALAPGSYYGKIEFTSPQATNSPLDATIVLRVAPTNAPPPPLISSTGLLLISVVGANNPASQNLTITDIGTKPSPFTAAVTSSVSPNPFSLPVASGTATPGTPLTFTVQASPAGLKAGIYRGTLTLTFPQENGSRTVDLLFIIAPSSGSIATKADGRVWEAQEPQAGGCTPSKLNPVFHSLGAGFSVAAAWPAAIDVDVADDCGTPMSTGSVVASFSNGDQPLALVGNGAGRWSATWAPISQSPPTITATANQPDASLTGQTQITGTVTDNAGVPVIATGGVVDGASYSLSATPSPGQIVAVFGSQFVPSLIQAQALPFPPSLGDLSLVIAGRSVPLIYASAGQVGAILPYGLTIGPSSQMIASRGTQLSVPVPVAISAGEPGIFTPSGNGQGQGHVYINGLTLADSNNPAKAGDAIVIYCGGLGEVSPAVDAGAAVPTDQLRNASNTVSLTIAGISAKVVFAGLTPGSAGLYQINAVVPAGIAPGNAVPVVITIGAVRSSTVTMAVK